MSKAPTDIATPMPPPLRRVTGLRLMFWILLVTGIITVWISWDVYHDPYDRMHGDLWALVQFGLGFNTMVGTIVLGIGLQRLHLDPQTRQLRYANLNSLHRWRSIDAVDVVCVRWNHAMNRPKALVDSLELSVRTGADPRAVKTVLLVDAGLTPAFGTRPSTLFAAVAGFVKACNPKAKCRPNCWHPSPERRAASAHRYAKYPRILLPIRRAMLVSS